MYYISQLVTIAQVIWFVGSTQYPAPPAVSYPGGAAPPAGYPPSGNYPPHPPPY